MQNEGKNMTARKKAVTRFDPAGNRHLYCPDCSEELQTPDIEVYPACPFCGCPLEEDSQFEDFILEPVVRSWIAKAVGSSGNARS